MKYFTEILNLDNIRVTILLFNHTILYLKLSFNIFMKVEVVSRILLLTLGFLMPGVAAMSLQRHQISGMWPEKSVETQSR